MYTEPNGTEVVERYLRTRRLRYFRGRHDGEYFFIPTLGRARLHVHIELTGAGAATIRVTPSQYFPAEDRPRLQRIIDSWNHDDPWSEAYVHESSDPQRVGVDCECRGLFAHYDDFVTFADRAIGSATELFGEITPANMLLDAG